MSEVSPLAPDVYPHMPEVAGVELGTGYAAIKYVAREDVTVIRAQAGATVAGVFTQNRCPGAPIEQSRQALALQSGEEPVVIVATAGNANVFTGRRGMESVKATVAGAAEAFGASAERVFIASTGVIGQPLPPEPIVKTLQSISLAPGNWPAAAAAILTTDTYPKMATRSCKIDGVRVTLNGIAKGSGMIAPDMATMLAFVATDAAIGREALQEVLLAGTRPSFNAITVDSDTSTSDTLLLVASGAAMHARIGSADDARLAEFRAALDGLLLELALLVVKDGEGASKFVTVRVEGAVSDESARAVALSVANSPLVKTAIAGEDANWGRIVMAVGKAGEPADRDRLTVRMGPHVLAEKGELAESYTEAAGTAYMAGDHIDIGIDLGMSEGEFTAYTCDLTHGYISINADYRS